MIATVNKHARSKETMTDMAKIPHPIISRNVLTSKLLDLHSEEEEKDVSRFFVRCVHNSSKGRSL